MFLLLCQPLYTLGNYEPQLRSRHPKNAACVTSRVPLGWTPGCQTARGNTHLLSTRTERV